MGYKNWIDGITPPQKITVCGDDGTTMEPRWDQDGTNGTLIRIELGSRALYYTITITVFCSAIWERGTFIANGFA